MYLIAAIGVLIITIWLEWAARSDWSDSIWSKLWAIFIFIAGGLISLTFLGLYTAPPDTQNDPQSLTTDSISPIPMPAIREDFSPLATVQPEYWTIKNIIETSSARFEIIDVSKIPAKNCVGGNIIRYSESISKASTEEIVIDTKLQGSINFLVVATLALEGEYQVKDGEQIQKTAQIEIEAKPGTNLEYRVVWKEVWADGNLMLKNNKGELMVIPYNVRRSIQSEIDNPIDLGCK